MHTICIKQVASSGTSIPQAVPRYNQLKIQMSTTATKLLGKTLQLARNCAAALREGAAELMCCDLLCAFSSLCGMLSTRS